VIGWIITACICGAFAAPLLAATPRPAFQRREGPMSRRERRVTGTVVALAAVALLWIVAPVLFWVLLSFTVTGCAAVLVLAYRARRKRAAKAVLR